MGIYRRADSPYWWLYLETNKTRERTAELVGETLAQKRDSRQQALEIYVQRMRELAASVHRLPTARPAIRFGKYADTYETDVIALRRGARRELEMLQPLRRYFGERLLSTIDAALVRAYMAARTKALIAPRTVNREVDILKGMLRDAVPTYLEASPIVGLKRLKVPPIKRRLLQVDEEARLLKVCEDAQDRAILIVAVDTLTRLSDLLDLERRDRDGAWLYIRDPKNGQAYETALSVRAQAALDAIETERYYFKKFRRAEDPHDWTGSVRQRLEYLCKKAGLPYGRAAGGLTFHWATRRTGATRFLIAQQAPLSVVQRQGGWKHPEVLLQVYAEARHDDQLRMVGALPGRQKRR